jgi:hypothetical protein
MHMYIVGGAAAPRVNLYILTRFILYIKLNGGGLNRNIIATILINHNNICCLLYTGTYFGIQIF